MSVVINTSSAIMGVHRGLSPQLRALAAAIATGAVLVIDGNAPPPEIMEIKLPQDFDFDLRYLEPKNEREPWRRGRPLRK